MERFAGLIFFIVSGVWLVALANSVPSREPHVGKQVAAWLFWFFLGIPALIEGRIGLGLLCGEAGATFDHKVREIVFWRRSLLFMRSVERFSPDRFCAIRVQKWKQRGFPVKLDGYAVALFSNDTTRRLQWFKTKNEAVESAKRLAACTHLAIEVE